MITAVKLPTLTGLVEKVTVSDVAVAAVTVPTAPLLKTMVLLASTELKPKPDITILLAVRARLVVFTVTTGVTVAVNNLGNARSDRQSLSALASSEAGVAQAIQKLRGGGVIWTIRKRQVNEVF